MDLIKNVVLPRCIFSRGAMKGKIQNFMPVIGADRFPEMPCQPGGLQTEYYFPQRRFFNVHGQFFAMIIKFFQSAVEAGIMAYL